LSSEEGNAADGMGNWSISEEEEEEEEAVEGGGRKERKASDEIR